VGDQESDSPAVAGPAVVERGQDIEREDHLEEEEPGGVVDRPGGFGALERFEDGARGERHCDQENEDDGQLERGQRPDDCVHVRLPVFVWGRGRPCAGREYSDGVPRGGTGTEAGGGRKPGVGGGPRESVAGPSRPGPYSGGPGSPRPPRRNRMRSTRQCQGPESLADVAGSPPALVHPGGICLATHGCGGEVRPFVRPRQPTGPRPPKALPVDEETASCARR
jgi:hypothetical protein